MGRGVPAAVTVRGDFPTLPAEQLTLSGDPGPSPLPFFAPQPSSETPATAIGATPAPFPPGSPPSTPWAPALIISHAAPGTPPSPWEPPLASTCPSCSPPAHPPPAKPWGGGAGGPLEGSDLGAPLSGSQGLPLRMGPSVSWGTSGAGTPGGHTGGRHTWGGTPGAGTPGVGMLGAGTDGVGMPWGGTAGTGSSAGGLGTAGTGATGAQMRGTGLLGEGAPRARLPQLPTGVGSPDRRSQVSHPLAPGIYPWGSSSWGAQSPARHELLVPPGAQRALAPEQVFPS